jgi:hypothetical protein
VATLDALATSTIGGRKPPARRTSQVPSKLSISPTVPHGGLEYPSTPTIDQQPLVPPGVGAS